jgi:hypothetical protein
MKPPIREKLPSDPIAALLALARGQYGPVRKPSETVRRLKQKRVGKSKRPVRHDER